MLEKLFTDVPGDMSRINVWGLALMLVGVLAVILARKVTKTEKALLVVKIGGMLVVMAGALIAMKLIG